MATQGPLYPGTVLTEIGPSGDDDWVNPGNVSADDGTEAQITVATFDAADMSYRLHLRNFGFTIPTDATINGIVVEIDRRCFAGAAQDQEVRIYDEAGVAVGDDKQTATAWPATLGIATYGSSSDVWSWTTVAPAKINDVDFGVALIALADAANTDIAVDFIRVTVHYTPSGNVVVTPSTIAIATTLPTPTVVGTTAGELSGDEVGRKTFGTLSEIGQRTFTAVTEIGRRWQVYPPTPNALVTPATIAVTTSLSVPTVQGAVEVELPDLDVSVNIPTPTIQITPAAQKARPDSDQARDTWTTDSGGTTNLWDSLNESAPSDADYVKSSVNPANDELIVTLTNIEDPVSSTGHVVRFRYRRA
jgi:hypothetical protein